MAKKPEVMSNDSTVSEKNFTTYPRHFGITASNLSQGTCDVSGIPGLETTSDDIKYYSKSSMREITFRSTFSATAFIKEFLYRSHNLALLPLRTDSVTKKKNKVTTQN